MAAGVERKKKSKEMKGKKEIGKEKVRRKGMVKKEKKTSVQELAKETINW